MDAFPTVVAALLGKALPKAPPPVGTAKRIVAAVEGIDCSRLTVGPWDLAGLVAQFLREEALKAPGKEPFLRVKVEEPWPKVSIWEEHGVDVIVNTGRIRHIKARSWHPKWLTNLESTSSPIEAALRKDSRRIPTIVPADPVWTEVLGLDHYLSPGQRDAVRASLLLEPGESLVVVLPTGGGKSLVGYAESLLDQKGAATTLIVVPTVALALDQEYRIRKELSRVGGHHFEGCIAYHSDLDINTKRDVRRRIAEGRLPLVIASPEAVVQALRPSLTRCSQAGRLRSIVIDEAHLVSQWGMEFRPDFQALAGVRRLLVQEAPRAAKPRTILLTATLTQEVWKTLLVLFGNPDLGVVAATHLRPEPDYFISCAPNLITRDRRVVEAVKFAPRPMILYTVLREDADKWFDLLSSKGLRRIGKIHGRTSASERDQYLRAWLEGRIDVMVATSAFGLGMDMAEVRSVIHACVPESLDRYYQEVGRGGRDGRACISILIYEQRDIEIARGLNRQKIIGVRKGLLRWKTMYNCACDDEEDEDRVILSLDSQPPYVQADSDANVAWNMRTLILLARAGLLELHSKAPPLLERGENESEEVFEQRVQFAFERYSKSVAVRLSGVNHLDPNVWEERVDPARQEAMMADKRTFEAVMRFLRGDARLDKLLLEAYTFEAQGIWVKPQTGRVSCPVSRADEFSRGSFTIPEPILVVNVYAEIRQRLNRLLQGRRFLLISIPCTRPEWRNEMIDVMKILISNGIREIRASRVWREIKKYRKLYNYTHPRIVFHTDLEDFQFDLSDQIYVPRATILESSDHSLDILAETRDASRPVDLVFVSEDIPDPTRSDRKLISIQEHESLERLRKELN